MFENRRSLNGCRSTAPRRRVRHSTIMECLKMKDQLRRQLFEEIHLLQKTVPNFSLQQYVAQEKIKLAKDIDTLQSHCKVVEDEINRFVWVDKDTFLEKMGEGIEYRVKVYKRSQG